MSLVLSNAVTMFALSLCVTVFPEPFERKLGKTLSKLRTFLLCNYIPSTHVTKPSIFPNIT